jgi:DNA-binding response OmpR family regulator
MTPSILVIEDDKTIQEYVQNLLVQQGYSVRTTASGITALELLHDVPADLVILDLQLPDIQGESVCLEIRKFHPDISIIMLTGKTNISEKLQGFNVGADDYMTKPFAAEELLARIKAQLRSKLTNDVLLKIDDLILDTKAIEVKRAGKLIALTPQEFKLLEYLLRNKNIVLSREMILNKVWSYASEVETRVVDVYMGYLRKKIDADATKKLIHSVRGFGYTLKE